MLFLSLAVPLLAAATPAEADPVPAGGPEATVAAPQAETQPDGQPAPTEAVPSTTTPPAIVMPATGGTAGSDIVVAHRRPSPADPAEQLNEVSFVAVKAVDSAVVGPIAHGYNAGLPKPLRDGVHNALDNLDEPIVFINFLLQLKPGKAAETLGRFAINSTIGVAGLFDVARRKPFNLPRRSNGLADTLGYYGVGPGPYLFLPIIGSTSLRDLIARPFDLMILPGIAPRPFANPTVSLGKGVLSALDERAHDDDRFTRIHAAKDPYAAQREEYLARRRAEIEVLQGKRKSIYDPPYYILPALPAKADGAEGAGIPESPGK